ncbi:MAG TPA: CDP-alcohol phosphatidyltransferase family protein [Solirubrobacterales bacterium]|nr:CDP-alcohol phosphatidyltransferase family protein [Solirubrobacterales bacterium]
MPSERTPVREHLSRRRLVGLDRSGPSPAATRKGAPLHPWTLPNIVGYLRLAAIPVFLVWALSSDDGRVTGATLLYLFITLGDLLDGFLARATGQYSRMGALLDPLVDRMAALAGVIVCWEFDLLPHWALIVLAIREVATLVLARLALRSGVDLEVSWIGRLATLFTFGGLFWTLVFDSWITVAMFLIGVALGIVATALYTRASRRYLAEQARQMLGSDPKKAGAAR